MAKTGLSRWIGASAGHGRDEGSVPRLGRSLGEGNGNPLQYSCLENPMDRGAWWPTVHEVSKNLTLTELLHLRLRKEDKDLNEDRDLVVRPGKRR